jgi:hypothetical protein
MPAGEQIGARGFDIGDDEHERVRRPGRGGGDPRAEDDRTR